MLLRAGCHRGWHAAIPGQAGLEREPMLSRPVGRLLRGGRKQGGTDCGEEGLAGWGRGRGRRRCWFGSDWGLQDACGDEGGAVRLDFTVCVIVNNSCHLAHEPRARWGCQLKGAPNGI